MTVASWSHTHNSKSCPCLPWVQLTRPLACPRYTCCHHNANTPSPVPSQISSVPHWFFSQAMKDPQRKACLLPTALNWESNQLNHIWMQIRALHFFIRGKGCPFIHMLVTQRGLSIYIYQTWQHLTLRLKTKMINFSSRDNFGDVYRPLKMRMLWL